MLSFVCSIGNVPLAAVLWNGGISFGGVLAFIFADLLILPIIDIYRRYYGWRTAAFIVVTFYASMVAGGYIIEFTFGGLGLVPTNRAAKVTDTGVTWNYNTILNIIFLLLAAALLVRFVRSGGAPMLKMMGGSPPQQQYTRDHSDVLPHPGAQPARQSLRAQISDHQDKIAVPSMGMAHAPTVPSSD